MNEWLQAVLIVVGILTSLAAAFAVVRSAGIRAQVDLMVATNSELRAENKGLREEIAELRGAVGVLTSDIVKSLMDQLGTALVSELREVLNNPDRRSK